MIIDIMIFLILAVVAWILVDALLVVLLQLAILLHLEKMEKFMVFLISNRLTFDKIYKKIFNRS